MFAVDHKPAEESPAPQRGVGGAWAGRGRGVGGAWGAGGSRQHLLPTMEMTLPKRDVGSQKIMSKKGKNGKRKKMKEDSL